MKPPSVTFLSVLTLVVAAAVGALYIPLRETPAAYPRPGGRAVRIDPRSVCGPGRPIRAGMRAEQVHAVLGSRFQTKRIVAAPGAGPPVARIEETYTFNNTGERLYLFSFNPIDKMLLLVTYEVTVVYDEEGRVQECYARKSY